MSRIPARQAASLFLTAVAAVALVAPPVALAHPGGEAFVHVPADNLVPGETFPVVGADLGQNAAVAIGLMIGGQVVTLGTVAAGPDGHFEATLVMPDSVDAGYVQLVAESTDGSFASTWVRVGTATTPGGPLSGTAFDLVDPSLLIAVAVLLGFALFRLARGRLRRAGRAPS